MKSQTIQAGESLSLPEDPDKENHIFGGWYTDSEYLNKAVFPMIISQNTTLYAQFYDYKSAFGNARNKTIGVGVAGFEYDYTTVATAKYDVLSLEGKTTGNAKYSNIGEVAFYDEAVNSGALFIDGSKYQIRRMTELQKVSLDENDLVKSFSSEEADASYRFDSSSFAKALFEYSDDQLKTISATRMKTNTSCQRRSIFQRYRCRNKYVTLL